MQNCAYKADKPPKKTQPPINTPAGYVYNFQGASTCKYLQKWENTSLRWPKWGTFDTFELIFLHAQLEKASIKIKINEWKAYPNQKLEACKWSTDKFSSLQEVSKTILETIA